MSSEDLQVTAFGGGVTRVQWGTSDHPDDQQPQRTIANQSSGTFIFDGNSGSVGHANVQRVTTADIMEQSHGPGLLATASEFNLKPTTRVTVGSTEMTLEMAERLGYVGRDAAGRYVEASIGKQGGHAQRQAQHVRQAPEPPTAQEAERSGEFGDVNDMRLEPLPQEIEQAIGQAVEGVGPETVTASLMDMASMMLESKGELSLEALHERVVSQTGLPPERAAAFMEVALGGLANQADAAIAKLGVDPVEMIEWAKHQQPEKLRAAINQHIGARSLNGYRALAKEFVKASTPTAERLALAGFQTMIDPQSKQLLVNYKGHWTPARSLALHGLI